MPSTPPDRPPSRPAAPTAGGPGAADQVVRRVVAALLCGVLALVAAGCSDGAPSSVAQGAATTEPTSGPATSAEDAAAASGTAEDAAPGAVVGGTDVPDVSGVRVPRDLARTLARLLTRRSAAVLAGDRDAFLADVGDGLAASQGAYFDNLAQLPLAELTYRLDRRSLVRDGDDHWVVVEVSTRLAGYDVAAVRTFDRLRFSPTPGGRQVLTSTSDAAWEAENRVGSQPWDLEPVTVRDVDGVLAVLDAGTAGQADRLLRVVEAARDDVRSRFPDWDGRVVVYLLGDDAFLDGLTGVPGGDADALDGLTVSVPTGPVDASGTPAVASRRVLLQPRVLGESVVTRGRLVRHELVHVAVGERDTGAPVWLTEGLAEWTSVQALPPTRRTVPEEALDAARDGIEGMPADAVFHDAPEVDYALAWWTCEYVAATYGPTAPWTLLDEVTAGVAAGEDPDDVVGRVLGLSTDQLARRGARLMLTTYDPAAVATESPDTDEPVSPDTSRVPDGEPTTTAEATGG
ncbi:MAG: hypothetical protein CMH83_02460 [Nocardioides sp.]|nr:hypothetical protein [Nocardioides sp.]